MFFLYFKEECRLEQKWQTCLGWGKHHYLLIPGQDLGNNDKYYTSYKYYKHTVLYKTLLQTNQEMYQKAFGLVCSVLPTDWQSYSWAQNSLEVISPGKNTFLKHFPFFFLQIIYVVKWFQLNIRPPIYVLHGLYVKLLT